MFKKTSKLKATQIERLAQKCSLLVLLQAHFIGCRVCAVSSKRAGSCLAWFILNLHFDEDNPRDVKKKTSEWTAIVVCYYEGPRTESKHWFTESKIQSSGQLGGFSWNSSGDWRQPSYPLQSVTMWNRIFFLPVFHHHPSLSGTGALTEGKTLVKYTLGTREQVENQWNERTLLVSHVQHRSVGENTWEN